MRPPRWLPAALLLAAACTRELPPGTTSFTVGVTTVRTDSVLDVVGVVWRLTDTAEVPLRGPVRHWFEALATQRGDSVFAIGREAGVLPTSLLLETWAAPDRPDSICGWVERGRRVCFSGNDPVRASARRFIRAAAAFGPRAAPIALEGVNEAARLRDLADVYTALTTDKSLDSAVMAYAGYGDLTFDVTLARTVSTLSTTPSLDPARPAAEGHFFLTPDPTYPDRSYRSPGYVWQAIGHQMAHAVVRRLLAERPDLAGHGWHLRDAVMNEMVRVGYTGLFWDEAIGEQLARAITIRVMAQAQPTITWAARSEALNTEMAVVPYLEDALARYEADRATYPTIADFAPELARALDSIPLEPCRAAPDPGLGLVGVARYRALPLWISADSPFRLKGLRTTDTIIAIDGDSVAATGLLMPTRQLTMKWANYLPAELPELVFRRGGREYGYSVAVEWVPRRQVRVASMAPQAATADSTLPICRWVRRALRR